MPERAVLVSLIRTHGPNLNYEDLNTLMIEVEAVVNSRSLTIETIADGTSEAAISPSNLLTIKSKVVMLHPRSLGTLDLFSRRISDLKTLPMNFGADGGRNFLLHFRQSKWSISRRNLTVAEIVLLKTEISDRNHWAIARVISCENDKNGMV